MKKLATVDEIFKQIEEEKREKKVARQRKADENRIFNKKQEDDLEFDMAKKGEFWIKRADGTIVRPEKKKNAEHKWTQKEINARRERDSKRESLYHICSECDFRDWAKVKMPHHSLAWKLIGVPKDCPSCVRKGIKNTFIPQKAERDLWAKE